MYKLFFSAALILYISGVNRTEAQSVDWQPQVRDIMISYKDSVVKAHILLQSENVETLNSLTYYWYSQNGINTNMGGYSGDLLHGEYQVYNNNKKLIVQGFFDHGLKNGTWKYWNSKGLLKLSMEYKNGLLDGEFYVYDTNGVQIEKRKYKAGKLQQESAGKMKIWKEDNKKQKQPVDSLAADSIK